MKSYLTERGERPGAALFCGPHGKPLSPLFPERFRCSAVARSFPTTSVRILALALTPTGGIQVRSWKRGRDCTNSSSRSKTSAREFLNWTNEVASCGRTSPAASVPATTPSLLVQGREDRPGPPFPGPGRVKLSNDSLFVNKVYDRTSSACIWIHRSPPSPCWSTRRARCRPWSGRSRHSR